VTRRGGSLDARGPRTEDGGGRRAGRNGGAVGTADVQGRMWSARARDWADVQEGVASPLYAAVLDRTGVGGGGSVLDLGCGAGTFCAMAAARGAHVAGVDVAVGLLEIARQRVPAGDFRTGDMRSLPHADDAFDLVTGFNAFQFAADPVAALREAARVARGGRVVVAVFGPREANASDAYLSVLAGLLPAPPPGAPGPYALSGDGALQVLAASAGLVAVEVRDVDCPWVYPDLPTALRGLMSPGPAVAAAARAGEEAVREAVTGALAPFRTPDGGYRLSNVFRYMLAADG